MSVFIKKLPAFSLSQLQFKKANVASASGMSDGSLFRAEHYGQEDRQGC